MKECCNKCGFPLDIEREPILLKNDVLSLIEYEDNKCEECGHQKDGTSIKIVKKKFDEIFRKKNEERERLRKFILHYHFLTKEERKRVCVELPRFMLKDYEFKGNEEDNVEEPFSWDVVYMEVLNNTDLSIAMLNNIKWRD